MKANAKQILLGVGIGTLAYLILNKLSKKKGEATSKVEGGFGNGINFADANGVDIIDGEYYNADGDFYDADGDFYDADGDFISAEGDYYDADGDDFYSFDGEFFGADGEETSEARGKRRGRKKQVKARKNRRGKVKKRGKRVSPKRKLAICQDRVKALTKARANLIAQRKKLIAQRTKLTAERDNCLKANVRKIDKKLMKSKSNVAQLKQQSVARPMANRTQVVSRPTAQRKPTATAWKHTIVTFK